MHSRIHAEPAKKHSSGSTVKYQWANKKFFWFHLFSKKKTPTTLGILEKVFMGAIVPVGTTTPPWARLSL